MNVKYLWLINKPCGLKPGQHCTPASYQSTQFYSLRFLSTGMRKGLPTRQKCDNDFSPPHLFRNLYVIELTLQILI